MKKKKPEKEEEDDYFEEGEESEEDKALKDLLSVSEEEEIALGYGEDVAALAYDEKRILSAGNPELDKKIGGGIPAGSLSLIEGGNDTGKSVVTQQMMWGGVNQGFIVAIYTTENTIKSLLKQMDSLSLGISDFFIIGRMKIYPIHMEGAELDAKASENVLQIILHSMRVCNAEVIVIDSATVFVMHSTEEQILNFFSSCKSLCDIGKTILITAHSHAFDENLLVRIRSICDVHLSLHTEKAGAKLVKTMEIAKLRGAHTTTGNIITFDVDPAFGLRVIPISMATL